MIKLKVDRAIVVEGRDDVDAVSRACDALIIPTHGFGITGETWGVIAKAYEEKGLIILTDPDLAGERIRKRLSERFPGSVQCYMAREDTEKADDIGIENAAPQRIAEAVRRALELHERTASDSELREDKSGSPYVPVGQPELRELGLTGSAGASELRARVCRYLGIGYGNSKAMIRKLEGFGIGKDELSEAIKRIEEKEQQK